MGDARGGAGGCRREGALPDRGPGSERRQDHIIEKIVDGRISSFYKDNVLYDQVYIRPEQFEGTIGDMVQQMAASMGENISVARFSRVQVGEASE